MAAVPQALARRAVLAGSLAVLCACAARPVAFDRAGTGDIRRVGLLNAGFPTSPIVDVTNGVGKQLGLIGLVTTAIVTGNRASAVTALMAAEGFDPQGYFNEQLAAQVQSAGFAVTAQAADPSRRSFLDTYLATSAIDAALDVFVEEYGFVAYADTDDAPYRPAVALSMRLVSMRDRSILMQDAVLFRGIDAPLPRPDGAPAPIAFTSFSDVTNNPKLALAGLRGALSYAASAVGKRLT